MSIASPDLFAPRNTIVCAGGALGFRWLPVSEVLDGRWPRLAQQPATAAARKVA